MPSSNNDITNNHNPYGTPIRPESDPDPNPRNDIGTDTDADTGLGDSSEGDAEAEAVFRDMTWEEIMDDLNARFLLNLPKEELGLIRVYWQAEQAHWFYEDYLRPLNPSLPALSQRQFTHLILQSSPIYTSETFLRSLVSSSSSSSSSSSQPIQGLNTGPTPKSKAHSKNGKSDSNDNANPDESSPRAQGYGIGSESGKPLITKKGEINYDNVWEEYCAYKRMVPCCGGILINEEGDKCLMVRGWKSNAGWSFPRGKINSEESEVSCAIREVEEETGFDLTGRINPKEFHQTQISAQTVTMFIVGGIDEGTVFETQTRKEIGAIEWVNLINLPTWTNKKASKSRQNDRKFYNVTPFVIPLKKWLTEHGYNPNPKPRKKLAQPQSVYPPSQIPNQSSHFRNLQPYQFEESDSSSPLFDSPLQPKPSATPIPHRDPSALDNLFSRFIHKQEQDLGSGSSGSGENGGKGLGFPSVSGQEYSASTATSQDRRHLQRETDDGLQRLFGNLDIVPPSNASTTEAPNPSLRLSGQGRPPQRGTRGRQLSQAETEKEEDDALARLLGGIGTVPSPVTAPALVPRGDSKEGKLLGIINGIPTSTMLSNEPAPEPKNAAAAPGPAPQQQRPQPQQQYQTQPPSIKPHQTHLLSMLSSPQSKPNQPHSQPFTTNPTKPVSLPTSPRPPSPGLEERRSKQRALLEMTLAGITEPASGVAATGVGNRTGRRGSDSHLDHAGTGATTVTTADISPRQQPPPSYSVATSITPTSGSHQGGPSGSISNPGRPNINLPDYPHPLPTLPISYQAPPQPLRQAQPQPTEHQRSLLNALFTSQPQTNPQSTGPLYTQIQTQQTLQNQLNQPPSQGYGGSQYRPPNQASVHGSIGTQFPQPQSVSQYRPPSIGQVPHPHAPNFFSFGNQTGHSLAGQGLTQQPPYGQNPAIGPMGHTFVPPPINPGLSLGPEGPGRVPNMQSSFNQYPPYISAQSGQVGGGYQPPLPPPTLIQQQQHQPYLPYPPGPHQIPGQIQPGYNANFMNPPPPPPLPPPTRPPPGPGPGQIQGQGPYHPHYPTGNQGFQQPPPPSHQRSPTKGYSLGPGSAGNGNGKGNVNGRDEMRSEREQGVYHPVPRPPAGTALGLINQR